MKKDLDTIFYYFINDEKIISIDEYGKGHINDTYLVVTEHNKYILQSVNSEVFDTPNLVSNYAQLISYTGQKRIEGKFFPIFVPDKSGNYHLTDSLNKVWRVCAFIDDSITYSISPSIEVSKMAGTTMGRFQAMLNKMKPESFKDTIVDFHNPERRLVEFYDVLKNSNNAFKIEAEKEIEFALNNIDIANTVSQLLLSGNLPVRITHNDPKLENIIFSKDTQKGYTIDLDTVMQGAIMFDFGDMARSTTSMAVEDEKDLTLVNFNIDHFTALCEGYFNEIKGNLTSLEKENILPGILSIVYIQGIRFLTDFLQESKYYKISYADHNLVRTRTQFKLLRDILDNESKVKEIINSTIG